MEYALMFVLSYAAFTTGSLYQIYRAHKKWENETLPVIRENEKLKALIRLYGIDHNPNQSAPSPE